VLTEIRRVLADGGLLAFTLERNPGEGVILGEGLRYAHSPQYVRAALATAGLTLSQLEEQSFRNESNAPVPGLVVVAAQS
jgi:predicted TPR repeat methyltransferase